MQEMEEIRVQSLGQEDPLAKEMATNSGISAWDFLWTSLAGYIVYGSAKESDTI